MKKLAVFLGSTVMVLGLTSCSYQGFSRYPCQEPKNWELEECKPPVCSVSGTCPVDLVGEEVFNGTTKAKSGATPNG
jgi:hypothetical protein